MKEIRVFSYGGGVQSTAVLAMQAMGQIAEPFDVFLFANVGHDSENPGTIRYIEEVAKPFAAQHGICFVEVHKTTYGKPETLLEYICRTERSVPIPARMSNGAPGNRSCTNDFKIKVIDKWIKTQGYSHATVGLGITIDEFTRMRDEQWHDTYGTKKIGYMKRREHPLIHMNLSQFDCHNIMKAAGVEIPPRSSCYFCSFGRANEWTYMRITDVNLFQCAILVEKIINRKRNALQKDYVYLHPSCTPLDRAVADQPMLPGFAPNEVTVEMCGGYCGV